MSRGVSIFLTHHFDSHSWCFARHVVAEPAPVQVDTRGNVRELTVGDPHDIKDLTYFLDLFGQSSDIPFGQGDGSSVTAPCIHDPGCLETEKDF